MTPYFHAWLAALALTLALELPIYILVLKRWGVRPAVGLGLGLAANLITHPLLWWVVPQFPPYWLWLLCAETGVVLTEASVVRLYGVKTQRALLVSLLANGVSTLAGLVHQGLIENLDLDF